MRMIDADRLKRYITGVCLVNGVPYTQHVFSAKAIHEMIDDQPTVEARPVHHSARTDADGVKWVIGENGWERKEE